MDAVLGITWNSTTEHGIGNQDEFLFDPVTFAYLGSGTGAVVSQGIVDAVRQRPGPESREGHLEELEVPQGGLHEAWTQPKKTSASW